jgi:hypothetical protein
MKNAKSSAIFSGLFGKGGRGGFIFEKDIRLYLLVMIDFALFRPATGDTPECQPPISTGECREARGYRFF